MSAAIECRVDNVIPFCLFSALLVNGWINRAGLAPTPGISTDETGREIYMSTIRRLLPAFMALTVACRAAVAAERFVSLDGSHQPPFTNWLTAATNI